MKPKTIDRRKFLKVTAGGVASLSLPKNMFGQIVSQKTISQQLYDIVWALPQGNLKESIYVGRPIIGNSSDLKYIAISSTDGLNVIINATNHRDGDKEVNLIDYSEDPSNKAKYDLLDKGLDDILDYINGTLENGENFSYRRSGSIGFYRQPDGSTGISESVPMPAQHQGFYLGSSKNILDYLMSKPEVTKYLKR